MRSDFIFTASAHIPKKVRKFIYKVLIIKSINIIRYLPNSGSGTESNESSLDLHLKTYKVGNKWN